MHASASSYRYQYCAVAMPKTQNCAVVGVVLVVLHPQAAPTIQTLNQGRSAGANMFKVIDRRPAIDLEAPGEEPAAVVGEIELRNVRFAYPARPDVWVFKWVRETESGRNGDWGPIKQMALVPCCFAC